MYRRTRKFIRGDLQIKVASISLFVAVFVLILNLQLNLAGLTTIANRAPSGTAVDVTLEAVQQLVIRQFVISLLVAVPLALTFGIIYSFRFSGPIYRFRVYLESLASGRWDSPCRLRRGDQLQDVCEAINTGVGALRDQIKKDNAVLVQVQDFLGENALVAPTASREMLERIKEQVAAQCAAYARRCPVTDSRSTDKEAAPPAVRPQVQPA